MTGGRDIKRKDDLLIDKINKRYENDEVVPYMGNPSLPSNKSSFEYDKDRVKVILRCHKNILYFAQHFFYIVNLDEGKQKIKLHDFQRNILRLFKDNKRSILCCSRQIGKALALDTPIPTPNGWKTMGVLKDGDEVYDENGKVCNVVKAHDVLHNRECYEVVFDNGEKIIADKDHLWFTQTKADRSQRSKDKIRKGSVKTTEEIKNSLLYSNGEPNHRIKKCFGVEGKTQVLPIDPYLLGVWLGDGHSSASRISVGSEDIDQFLKLNTWENISISEDKRTGCKYVGLLKENKTNKCFHHYLKELNIFNNKHIPIKYMLSDKSQRLELLKGLMDTDGCVKTQGRGSCEISLANEELANNTYDLILSLGYKASINKKHLKNKNAKIVYRIQFKPHDIVFKYERKKVLQNLPFDEYDNRINYHYIKEINKVKSVPVRCITVDSENSLYLAGKSYIPTHNTTMLTIYALWLTTFFEHQQVVIVANKEKTAQEILSRIKLAYEELPNWIKPSTTGWGKQEVSFDNGSGIKISATSSDAIRGMAVSALLIDEQAFIDNHIMQAFWSAVLPTISSSKKAKVLICSTPNGVGNLFHELWTKSQENMKDWGSLMVKWFEVPGKDEEWARQERIALGDDLFEQEYECKFLESSESFIPENLYNNLLSNCITSIATIPKFEENYKIFKKPNLDESFYSIGVDVGDGIGQAASVIQVLDISDLTNIEQVAIYHSRDKGVYDFAKILIEIASHWGNPPLAIERNNMGASVINDVMNHYNYPNILNFAKKEGKIVTTHLPGVIAHTNTKHDGVYNMWYWLKQLQVLKLHDEKTLKELKTFVRHKNNKWAKKNGEGIWDDRVDALVWALVCLIPELTKQFYNIELFDGNKKPLQITPIYEIKRDKNSMYDYLFAGNENNYGALTPFFGGDNYESLNPDMDELKKMGWEVPGQYDIEDYNSKPWSYQPYG